MYIKAVEGNVTYLLDTGCNLISNTVNEEQAHALFDGKKYEKSSKYEGYNLAFPTERGVFYLNGEPDAEPAKPVAKAEPKTRGKKANGSNK